ncbi:MAG: KUP/HAK/KT family potassium transporter [bacterium]
MSSNARAAVKGTAIIGAIGIVFGDIGTSPLYAMKEAFFGRYRFPLTPENVYGIISLFIWALIIVVTVKYVFLIMRADNHGEGGILALLGLVKQGANGRSVPVWMRAGLITTILVGAVLLYGDGVITPAISVLSAIEGLKIIVPGSGHLVIPITILILGGLFAIQKYGSQKVGSLFGPIMILWFITIGTLGLLQIIQQPEVLLAINPWYAVRFVVNHSFHTLWVLGAVVLCITGGEALYADMGHFGRPAITRAWMYLIFPALCLNYFGQGAYMLSGREVPGDHLFYALAPSWALTPYVILATVATIIASQSLISGAFSLTQQSVALGVFPRVKIVHTNPEVEGQIYLPFINWMLFIGCAWLVLAFKSSSNLAAAYGIAVTGTMGITTFAFAFIACYHWGWNRYFLIPMTSLLLFVDLAFFSSKLLKFPEGGYVPIMIGAILFIIMDTWRWGRAWLAQAYNKNLGNHFLNLTVADLLQRKGLPNSKLGSRSLVVMAARPILNLEDKVPLVMATHYDNWLVIPKHLLFLSVVQVGRPFVPKSERYKVITFQQDIEIGTIISVQAFYGYMQQPNIRRVLLELKEKKLVKIPARPKKWLILIGAERFISHGRTLLEQWRLELFSFMSKITKPATSYFGLDEDPEVTIQVINV